MYDGTESGSEGEETEMRGQFEKGSLIPSVKMGWIVCYALVGYVFDVVMPHHK